MEYNKDGKGQDYFEIGLQKPSSDKIRVTYVKSGWDGSPCVRIQLVDTKSGKVLQGPEIPVGQLSDIKAMLTIFEIWDK